MKQNAKEYFVLITNFLNYLITAYTKDYLITLQIQTLLTARIGVHSIFPHQESDLISHVLVINCSALLIVDSVSCLQRLF